MKRLLIVGLGVLLSGIAFAETAPTSVIELEDEITLEEEQAWVVSFSTEYRTGYRSFMAGPGIAYNIGSVLRTGVNTRFSFNTQKSGVGSSFDAFVRAHLFQGDFRIFIEPRVGGDLAGGGFEPFFGASLGLVKSIGEEWEVIGRSGGMYSSNADWEQSIALSGAYRF